MRWSGGLVSVLGYKDPDRPPLPVIKGELMVHVQGAAAFTKTHVSGSHYDTQWSDQDWQGFLKHQCRNHGIIFRMNHDWTAIKS